MLCSLFNFSKNYHMLHCVWVNYLILSSLKVLNHFESNIDYFSPNFVRDCFGEPG